MDLSIRKLEKETALDPTLRENLLHEYIKAEMVTPRTVEICAILGHPECKILSGMHWTAPSFHEICRLSLPRKVFLLLGQGALIKTDEILNDTFIEGDETTRKLRELCIIFHRDTLAAFIENLKGSIIDVPGYRVKLTPKEYAGVVSENDFLQHTFGINSLPRILSDYYGAHKQMARATLMQPGKRLEQCFVNCIDATNPNSLEIKSAAINHVFQNLLGPYLVG